MAADLARNWWLLALRGVVGILFGIGAFVWPGATLAALILVFGAYVFVDGIFAVVAGIGMRRQLRLWWLVLVEGVAGIVLGLLTFRSPDTTTLVLLTFIAAWSIVTGIFEIATALRMRTLIANEWLLILSGAVSIICRPGTSCSAASRSAMLSPEITWFQVCACRCASLLDTTCTTACR